MLQSCVKCGEASIHEQCLQAYMYCSCGRLFASIYILVVSNFSTPNKYEVFLSWGK